jgi:type II secretory pathway component GspD/PulD (secretin)
MERRKSMKKALLFALAAGLIMGTLSLTAVGQEKTSTPTFKTEMVKLKYVAPQDIQNVLRIYLGREGQLTWSPGNEKLLVIKDTSENLARVLEVIKEIDVKPADILFTVQLVLGSEAGEGKMDDVLQNDQVVAELKKLLRYKTFSLLDQNIVRTLDQRDAEILIGKDPEFMIAFRRPKYIKDGNADLIQADIRLVRLERESTKTSGQNTPPATSSTALVQTSLTMKSGEKTVVGVSKLDGGDKGLILIISGKVIN